MWTFVFSQGWCSWKRGWGYQQCKGSGRPGVCIVTADNWKHAICFGNFVIMCVRVGPLPRFVWWIWHIAFFCQIHQICLHQNKWYLITSLKVFFKAGCHHGLNWSHPKKANTVSMHIKMNARQEYTSFFLIVWITCYYKHISVWLAFRYCYVFFPAHRLRKRWKRGRGKIGTIWWEKYEKFTEILEQNSCRHSERLSQHAETKAVEARLILRIFLLNDFHFILQAMSLMPKRMRLRSHKRRRGRAEREFHTKTR